MILPPKIQIIAEFNKLLTNQNKSAPNYKFFKII
jgi:hypothetical protein